MGLRGPGDGIALPRSHPSVEAPFVVARVMLDLAIGREFDYSIPEAMSGRLVVGSRVRVPFGHGSRLGVVTGVVESSDHGSLKAISSSSGNRAC